jgi:hypothetical protein
MVWKGTTQVGLGKNRNALNDFALTILFIFVIILMKAITSIAETSCFTISTRVNRKSLFTRCIFDASLEVNVSDCIFIW